MSQDTEQQVCDIIGKHCPPGTPTILPSFTLTDIGIDSLNAMEILFDIEDHFKIELPDRDPSFDSDSVQGLVNAVTDALAAKASAAQAPSGQADELAS